MARQTMGTSAATAKNVSGSPERGKLVKKGNAAASDPAATGAGNRSQTTERLGAAYKIAASVAAPQVDPAAGATQANGRIIRPVINRSNVNFYQAMADVQAQ